MKSKETLCYNIRGPPLKYFDTYMVYDLKRLNVCMAGNLQPIRQLDNSKYFTDVQKFFSLLVSRIIFSLKEIEKRFCPVGVRWLGFLASILHNALTRYIKLRDILEGIPASDIQNKIVKGLNNNTKHCLEKVNRDHKDIVSTRYFDLVLCITNVPKS